MKRLPLVAALVALLLSGCESPPPLKATKSDLHPMSNDTKQAISDQSKDAEAAAKETTFGDKK